MYSKTKEYVDKREFQRNGMHREYLPIFQRQQTPTTAFEVVENEISLLSSYLQINDIETVLFANAFVMWFENSCFPEVFEYFRLSKFQVLKYIESIEVLFTLDLNSSKFRLKIDFS